VLTTQTHGSPQAGHSERRGDVTLTVAQALVRYLSVQYSRSDGKERRLIPALFGIFGHGNVAGLGQALVEYGDELPYYQPFNEQSMVHTAAGFAKATHRAATFACASSIGPGATNMITGAALATINRLPVMLLPADYYATRRQGNVLQQLEHPISVDESVNDCFRTVSRFFDRILRPEQLVDSLPEAIRVLTDPADTGAVTIALPQDVQSEACAWPARMFDPRVWEIERRPPVQARINELVDLLAVADRPFLIAGGGVQYSEAWAELADFATAFGIPVGETSAGKGAFRGDERLQLGGVGATGNPAAAALARDADLVLCVGTRLTDFTTGSRSLFQHPEVRFAAINVVAHDAIKLGALPILADAREALRAATEVGRARGLRPNERYVEEAARRRGEWRSRLESEVFPEGDGRLSQAQVLGILNEFASPGDTVVGAAGSPPADLLSLWDSSGRRDAHIEFGFSCMGYEIPASLGVRLAQPEGEVYALVGDGTYLLNPSEVATAVQEGLKITLVVSCNDGFQCIRDLQLKAAGHDFGNEFRYRDRNSGKLTGDYISVDIAANAASFGAQVWKVDTDAELRRALTEARAASAPCLIAVTTDRFKRAPDSEVWWDVAPAAVSLDELTQRIRADYERARQAQRYYG
jgi:3D-(3,5/4)-trihydroxycyclohexane-1,2-dione acylhydrolase (decyclizing)